MKTTRILIAPAFLAAIHCSHSPPDAHLVTATEIGVLQTSDVIQGRDGGYSLSAWGRSVWLYGDTVLASADENGENWHHNSFSTTEDDDASDGLDGFVEPRDGAGAPVHFLSPTADERAYNLAHLGEECAETPCGARWATWPSGGAYDQERDRVLIFYSKLHAAPGELNFYSVGQSLAVWHSPESAPERPVLDPDGEHPTLLFPGERAAMGLGVNIEGEHLYTFMCWRDYVTHHCGLARVPLSDALTRAAWEYYTGSSWSPRRSDLEALFAGAPIMDVFFNTFLERYTAIYSRPLSRDVALRTARALTGPWSDELVLFRADSERDVYDALPHREFAEAGGQVQYITFSRPTGTGWFDAELPIVRVELDRPSAN